MPAIRKPIIGYIRLHKWINKVLGHPSKCEICLGVFESKYMEWSNKDHLYTRDIKDWQRLCKKCHKAYDRGLFGIKCGAGNKTSGRKNRI